MNKKILLIIALIFSLSNCTSVKEKITKIECDIKNQFSEAPQFLFVQRAATTSYNGKTLALNRVFYTDFFADKTHKFIRQAPNKEFFGNWVADSKNIAIISYQGKDSSTNVATLELSKPKLGTRNSISYEAKVISGKLPKVTSEAALFIDSATGL